MANVVRAVPDARLVVIGEGDDRDAIAEFGAELGLGDNLLFRAAAKPLDRWYRGAQVFAMPAEGEGFGLVYLEAMGRGLPVVAGASGASLEIIDDGKCGFLVARTIIGSWDGGSSGCSKIGTSGNDGRRAPPDRRALTAARFAARLYQTLGRERIAHQPQEGTAARLFWVLTTDITPPLACSAPERCSRRIRRLVAAKESGRLSAGRIASVLRIAGISLDQVDRVAYAARLLSRCRRSEADVSATSTIRGREWCW